MNIKEIKERAEKATPGPWWWSRQFLTYYGVETFSLIGDGGFGVLSCDGEANSPQRCHADDAPFISHSRADIPALVDWIERAAFVLHESGHHKAAALLAELEAE